MTTTAPATVTGYQRCMRCPPGRNGATARDMFTLPLTASQGLRSRQRPLISEEEHDLFVDKFPDAVEQRVAHAVVAAADLGVNLGAAHQQTGLQLRLFRQTVVVGNVVTGQADVSEDNRFGLVVFVLVWVGAAGDVLELAL